MRQDKQLNKTRLLYAIRPLLFLKYFVPTHGLQKNISGANMNIFFELSRLENTLEASSVSINY